LTISACGGDSSTGNLQTLSLLEYGIPGEIKAPLDAEINTMDFGAMKDITVKKGDDYSVQIYASDATTLSLADVKAQQLGLLKQNPYFEKVITEEDNGFIYENKVDSTTFNYGFRYIKLQADKEYIYQTGLIGSFTKEQVQTMYDSVK